MTYLKTFLTLYLLGCLGQISLAKTKLETIEFCKNYYEYYGSDDNGKEVTYVNYTIYAPRPGGKLSPIFQEIKIKETGEMRETYSTPGYPEDTKRYYVPLKKLSVDQRFRITTMKFVARKKKCPEIKDGMVVALPRPKAKTPPK